MKYTFLASRLLLGLMFLILGLNNILHFLPMPAMAGQAGLYMGVLAASGIMKLVGVLLVITGLLLLVGRFVPLALVLLGPLLGNILVFHAFLDPGGIVLGLVATLLWFITFFAYRANFLPLFEADPGPQH